MSCVNIDSNCIPAILSEDFIVYAKRAVMFQYVLVMRSYIWLQNEDTTDRIVVVS